MVRKFTDDKELNKILNICDEFLQVPSVISYEKPFIDYLHKKIKALGFKTVKKKNFLAVETKSDSRKLFCAHIDRHGCVQDKKGRIQFASFYLKKKNQILSPRCERAKSELKFSRVLNEKLKGMDVFLGKENLKFKYEDNEFNFERKGSRNFYEKAGQNYTKCDFASYNAKTGEIIDKYKALRFDVEWKQSRVWFDMDKKYSKAEKPFMLHSRIEVIKDKFFAQIDNVISVAVLYYLLEKLGPKGFQGNVLFTTKEEIGLSYESYLDYQKLRSEKRFELVVLDTSPYDKFPLEESFLVLRKGDERKMFNLELTREVKRIVKKNQVKFRFKNHNIGRTELGAIIQHSRKKIVGTTLQLPTTNYHTGYETSRLKDLENFTKVVEELCAKKRELN